MRFTCEKSMLVNGLNITGRTVAQKSALSAIEGILCRAGMDLSLTGYNMETAITYNIEAEIADPGVCILPAKLFGDIIRRLPEGPVTVVVDDNFKVSIRAGYASFTISAENADDYPELPDVGTGRSTGIPQSALKELIGGTIFAVSEPIQAATSGIFVVLSCTASTTTGFLRYLRITVSFIHHLPLVVLSRIPGNSECCGYSQIQYHHPTMNSDKEYPLFLIRGSCRLCSHILFLSLFFLLRQLRIFLPKKVSVFKAIKH